MSGRSPSGVASLRARFEQKGESTSPPSRGRSPAGSVTSDSSRPISKVRTSFVSVEGSGRMSDQLGMKEPMETEAVVGDGVDGSKAAANGDGLDKPQPNGGSLQPASVKALASDAGSTKKPKQDGPKLANTSDGATDGPSGANPSESVSTAEDTTPKMLPSASKDEGALSGGAALGDETPGLGSILKGSPFEQEKAKKASSSDSSKAKPALAPSQSPKKHTKPPINSSVNGKAKETQSPKPAPQTKAKAAPVPAAPKSASPPSSSHTPKTPESKPNDATRPAQGETQPANPPAASNIADTPKSKIQRTTPPGPSTPTSATASGKMSTPKKASPKLAPSKDPKEELANDIKKPRSRTSAAAKPAPAASSKPSKPAPSSGSSAARPVDKPGNTSPKQSFSKPRPKSPTRPGRLPAAATALTAASAAKLDGSPPSENIRKPKDTLPKNMHIVGKLPPNPAKPQPKPTRTSLPAGSKPVDKSKASKPRTSMVSSKAPEGSFLERMMRPTQSSSQKTHDKAPKPPQSKHQGTKPKRTSEGSDKSKTEHGETKAGPSDEPASVVEAPTESSETPSTNGASLLASVAVHTVPATNSAP